MVVFPKHAALFSSHCEGNVLPSFEQTGLIIGSQLTGHWHWAMPNLFIAHSSPRLHRTLMQGLIPAMLKGFLLIKTHDKYFRMGVKERKVHQKQRRIQRSSKRAVYENFIISILLWFNNRLHGQMSRNVF